MKTSTVRRRFRVALVPLYVAGVFGCASQVAPIGYALDGQPGRAASVYGSPQAAQAAFDRHAAGCDFEVAKYTPANPVQPAGGLVGAYFTRSASDERAARLFNTCMAAQGWQVITAAGK